MSRMKLHAELRHFQRTTSTSRGGLQVAGYWLCTYVIWCRELLAKKQEAQALVSEMECTAQAFEEVQEQNLRLLDQIKEKDDANFKVSGLEPYCGVWFMCVGYLR